MAIWKKLPTVSNVAEGATFTVNCPVGLTYGKIKLVMGGGTFLAPHLLNLRVNINGKTVQSFATGTWLNSYNQYYGRPNDVSDSLVTLYFARPELQERWRYSTALGTSDVDTLTITGDISGSTSPTLEAYAELLPASPLGAFTKIKEFPITFAAGLNDVDKIPKGPRISNVFFKGADFTYIEAEVDGLKIYDSDTGVAESFQKSIHQKRVPDGATYSATDFVLDGDLGSAIATAGVQDLRFKPTKTAGATVDVVVEYIDGFNGL